MNLVRAAPKQAGDVRLGEKVPHVLGEEQHAGVAEEQAVTVALRHFDVHQHVFHRMPTRYAGQPQPRIEFRPVEVLRVAETRARHEVEPDHAFGAEEVAYLVAAHLLRHRALPPEEPVAALHGLCVALPHLHREHVADPSGQHLHRRVAVAGDVLNSRPQRVGVLDALHHAIVAHAKQNPAAGRVGQGDQLPRKGRREALLELQRRALALLNEDVDVRCSKRHGQSTSATHGSPPDLLRNLSNRSHISVVNRSTLPFAGCGISEVSELRTR